MCARVPRSVAHNTGSENHSFLNFTHGHGTRLKSFLPMKSITQESIPGSPTSTIFIFLERTWGGREA